jgi:hypothetical protein
MENIKKIFIVIVLFVLLVGAGIGVYILIFRHNSAPSVKKPEEKQNVPTTSSVKQSPEKVIQNFSKKLEKLYEKDSDLDGLTNQEETKYGTDPENIDSDGDGLTDKDELFLYRTDPLKADSDGDGYADAYEIDRGYNPLGPGRIK